MGWFDFKSWKLRRKLKDLQEDLREAEKDGKYVLEDGLFFAELEDMGEMTMMVFGTSGEQLASQEETVIRQFFERNGFSVADVKFAAGHTALADIELIPTEEMTRAIGKILRADAFKIVNDSDKELPADLSAKILPLSSLLRAISILFAERVQQTVATTRIKMNKEGNRLLHWLPKIVEALEKKVSRKVVEAIREAFNDGYVQFYSRIGRQGGEVSPMAGGKPSGPQPLRASAEPTPAQKIPTLNFQGGGSPTPSAGPTQGRVATPAPGPRPMPPRPETPAVATPKPDVASADVRIPRPAAPTPIDLPQVARTEEDTQDVVAKPRMRDDHEQTVKLMRDKDLAEAMMRMYKSLVKANSSRCVRNAEKILEEVRQLFGSSAVCIMVKVVQGHGLTIQAQAGRRLTYGADGEGFPVSATVLSNCIRHRDVVTNQESGDEPTSSMVSHGIGATAAAPIVVNNEVVGLLYLDRVDKSRPFNEIDRHMLRTVLTIFEDYPDLTLGLL